MVAMAEWCILMHKFGSTVVQKIAACGRLLVMYNIKVKHMLSRVGFIFNKITISFLFFDFDIKVVMSYQHLLSPL